MLLGAVGGFINCNVCLYLSIYIYGVCGSSRWSMLLGALGGGSLYLPQAAGSRQSLYFLIIVLILCDPSYMRNLFLLEMRSYIRKDQLQGRKEMMMKRRSTVPCLEVGLWTSSTYHLHGLPFKTLLLCVKHIHYCLADLPDEPYLAVPL